MHLVQGPRLPLSDQIFRVDLVCLLHWPHLYLLHGLHLLHWLHGLHLLHLHLLWLVHLHLLWLLHLHIHLLGLLHLLHLHLHLLWLLLLFRHLGHFCRSYQFLVVLNALRVERSVVSLQQLGVVEFAIHRLVARSEHSLVSKVKVRAVLTIILTYTQPFLNSGSIAFM